jgi:peptide chain release factor 3
LRRPLPGTPAGALEEVVDEVSREVGRRRTFAIISHPDAGKTTLTEKLLLYGGALHLAGSVKARRAERHATSDWMKLEQERGISVTSSVLQFDYEGFRINLLDTPGHQDFSEDTYRTLMAADSAVMLLDNRKGVEEQTRKLFEVCKLRRLPIFTFVNKCDRAGESPLKLLDDVEAELGIRCWPVTWPIFRGAQFLGVYDRLRRRIHLFERGEHHGQRRVAAHEGALEDPAVRELLGADVHDAFLEEIELLDLAGAEFEADAFAAGAVSPTFFGSALTNFGVEPFLEEFLRLAPAPVARAAAERVVEPEEAAFTGFVFKIQANMDPKHRDRIAFVRICSGRFTAGMSVLHVRSGREIRLAAPQQFLARERIAIEEAWAGDVVGIHDRGTLRIGDTLSADGALEFAGVPRFSPERFARISVPDPLRRKHLDTGLRQLSEEGAAQVFYPERGGAANPIVGAVGQLQFDVMLHRLEHEYGVPARLERLPFQHARWVEGDEARIRRLADGYGRAMVYDSKERPLLLFESGWALAQTMEKETTITFHAVAP